MRKVYIFTILISCFLFMALSLSACADRTALIAADRNARKMMEQYNLHPVKEPEIRDDDFVRRLVYGEGYFGIFDDASNQVGLDLNNGKREHLTMLTYVLEERSQSHEGTVSGNYAAN